MKYLTYNKYNDYINLTYFLKYFLMNNQKKINEILYSIQELILEAQNEKKLDFVQTNEVIELNKINTSKTDKLENNQDYTESYVNNLIKTKEVKTTELEPM